jgi:GT2 family glycosyltransferase
MSATVPVSVVLPTIGRTELLRQCLESLRACSPRADEIVVVDQSSGDEVSELVAEFAGAGARALPSRGRGISLAMNEGLREARHDVVLVTHDDCTVSPDWVEVGHRLMAAQPEQILTGRVLPVGPPERVPSTKDDPDPQDFTGQIKPGALFPSNMAVSRDRLLAFGAFDERFTVAAEDVDLAYRWLRAGRPMHYRPELVVNHHDWRAPDALRRAYRSYHRGRGQFYAKHLRRGDPRMLRYLVLEVYWSLSALPGHVAKRRAGSVDRRDGALGGVARGVVSGWRLFRDQEGYP